MLKTVLFDLDGTLLPIDGEEFIRRYLHALGAFMSGMLDPRQLVSHLLAATGAMISPEHPGRTNQEVFRESFCAATGIAWERLEPPFQAFYQGPYEQLAAAAAPSPSARQAVEGALARGLEVAVATNPVFPQLALRSRLRWAGVGDFLYQVVTGYEEWHACKPGLAYYREVLAYLGRRPEECLMVGNDVQEDMVAGELGLRTYLVTDWLIDRGEAVRAPDGRGSLEELVSWLHGL